MNRKSTYGTYAADRSSVVIPRPLIEVPSFGSLSTNGDVRPQAQDVSVECAEFDEPLPKRHNSLLDRVHQVFGQLPAIAIISLLNLMVDLCEIGCRRHNVYTNAHSLFVCNFLRLVSVLKVLFKV